MPDKSEPPAYRRIAERYEGRSRPQLWAEGLAREQFARVAALGSPPPPIRFVIWAQGRTGSTLTTSSLNSHLRIRCADEILNRPVLDPGSYVENRARAARREAFGFHVKCYQLTRLQRTDDWADFLQRLASAGWKIIYLRRENVVQHVFSGIFMQAIGRTHFRNDKTKRPDAIHVDVEELSAWISNREDLRRDEQAALEGLPFFELLYEQHLLDPEHRKQAFAEMQDFLGIERRGLETRLSKSVRRPLRAMIANFEEVHNSLKGTAYEAQLLA